MDNRKQNMSVLSKFLLGNCHDQCARKVRNLSGTVFLCPGAISPKFKDFLVETTTKEIEELGDLLIKEDEEAKNRIQVTQYSETTRIRRMSKGVKEKQRRTLNDAYKLVTRYSNEEITKEYQKNSKKWQDWCNDVFIYCLYDFHINGKPLPIAM